MPEENAYVSVDFSAEDVINGLMRIVQHGDKVVDVLGVMAAAGQKMADNLVAEFKRVANGITKPIDETAQVIARVDGVFKQIKNSISQVQNQTQSMDMKPWEQQALAYKNQIKQIQQEIQKLESQVQKTKMTDAERNVAVALLKQHYQDLNKLAAEQAKHVQKIRDTEQAKLGAGVTQAAKQGMTELTQAASIASVGLNLALVNATKSYAGFEGQLVQYKAISKASTEQTEQFKNTAMSLSVMGQSSDNVAKLGAELAKAGLSADETNRALQTITTAAVAMDDDLVASGEAIDSVRTQFGLGIGEIERVSNGLVLAANESKVSLGDLNESYKYLGTSAAQSNQPLEDTNALLVLLGNSGIKASMAGNGLQNAFLRMADPKIRDSIKKIGVDVTDGHGKLRKMTDIVIDMQKALRGVDDVNKSAFLKEMFGEVALNPMLALLGQTEEKIRQTTATMQNWSGVQDRIAKEMQQGLSHNLKVLGASFDNFQKNFIEALKPIMIPVMKFLSELFNGFNNLPGPIKTIIATGTVATAVALSLASAFGLIALAGGKVFISLGLMANGFVKWATGAPAVAAANLTISQSFTAMRTGMATLPAVLMQLARTAMTSLPQVGSALMAAAGPVLPFIALAAALYAAWELNLGGFRDIMMVTYDALSTSFGDMWAAINDFIAGNQESWFLFWEAIKTTLITALGLVDTLLAGMFENIGYFFSIIGDVMMGNWSSAWEYIGKLFNGMTGGISGNLSKWMKSFGTLFMEGMSGLGDMVKGLWDVVFNPGNAAAGLQQITAGFEKLKGAAEKGADGIKGAWDSMFDSILQGANDLYKRGMDKLPTVDLLKLKKPGEDGSKAPPFARNDGLNKQIEGMLGDKGRKGENPYVEGVDEFLQNLNTEYANKKKDRDLAIDANKELVKTTEDVRQSIADTAVQWVKQGPDGRSEADRFAMRDTFAELNKNLYAQGVACDYTVKQMMKMAGVPETVLANWTTAVPHTLQKLLDKKLVVEVSKPAPGDIVVGRYQRDPQLGIVPHHTELYVGDGKTVGARNSIGYQIGKGQRITHGNQWMKDARYFRLTDAALEGMGGSREATEADKNKLKAEGDIKDKVAMYEAIGREMLKLNQADKQQKAAWDKLKVAHDKIGLELKDAKIDLQKAANKIAEEHKKAVEEANKTILGLRQSIAKRLVDLGQIPNEDLMEAKAEADREKLAEDHKNQLKDFKGTEKQKADIQSLQKQEAALLEEQIAKEQKERRRQLANELKDMEISFMQEGLERQKAEIAQRLANELHAITEKQKLYAEDSEEWKRLEALKTKATDKANRDRVIAGVRGAEELAQAVAETINSELSASEQQFVSTFESLIQEGMAKGLNGADLSSFISRSDNALGLAGALGAGDLEKGIFAINSKLIANIGLVKQARDELAVIPPGTKEHQEVQAKLNTLLQQQAAYQALAGQAGDESLQNLIARAREYALAQDDLNRNLEVFQSQLSAVGDIGSAIAGTFGEIGATAGAAISKAQGIASQFSIVMNTWKKAESTVAKGESVIAKIFGDPTQVKDVVGLVSVGVAFVGELINGLAEAQTRAETFHRALVNQRYQYETQSELEAAEQRLAIRKQAGEDVLADELALIDRRAEYEEKRLIDERDQFNRDIFYNSPGFGNNRAVSADGRAKQDAKISETDAAIAKNERDRLQKREEAEKSHQDRMAQLAVDTQSRITEAKILAAQNAGDKTAEIEANAEQQKVEASRKYLTDILALAALGDKATAQDWQAQADSFKEKMASIDASVAKQKRENDAATRQAEVEAEFDHREHLANMKEEGFSKELELMKLAKERESEVMAAELLKYEENTEEWKRLSQKKADAEEAAQDRISKAIEENKKKQKEALEDLKLEIAELEASGTESGLDDIAVKGRNTLAKLAREEETARRDSIANAGDDEVLKQELLSAIAKKYNLMRANTYKDIEKELLEEMKAEYRKAGQEKLDAQIKPVELAIKKEEQRVRVLERQNQEYERQNQLIDERFDKLNRDFDARDKAEFEQKLAGVDREAARRMGIDAVANVDVQGDELDRSTKATQLRGLKELLESKQKELQADLDLENISQEKFATEMENIILMRAALTQDAIAEAKTDKERAQLKAELAEEYMDYQKLIKEGIEAQREAEKKQNDELIANNNREINSTKAKIDSEKYGIEQLQQTFDIKMDQIDLALKDVIGTQDAWVNKIRGIAPEMVQMAAGVVTSLQQIKNTFNEPLSATAGYGSSYYATPFYQRGDTSLPAGGIPSRSSAMTDQDGVFSVQGNNGKWYRTTSEMERAIAGYAEGGDIPDLPQYANDMGIVRISGAEKILNRINSKQLNGMLSYWNAHQRVLVNGGSNQKVNVYVDVSRDVDLGKLENVMAKYVGNENRKTIKRMGQNGMRRS